MKTKIYFSPDYSATSLFDEEGYNREYEDFPLSAELVKQLEEFDDSIWEIIQIITEQRRWEIYRNGLRLRKLVSLELGDKYEVIEDLDWLKP